MTDNIILFHSPQTRSAGARMLVEELGADVEIRLLNMRIDEQRDPAFLAINPMGKVPAVLHGDAVITEQVAVLMYLADLFPACGLAPKLDDRRRGPYLRWMAYYAASFEPAVVDRAMKREPGPAKMSPYGDFDTMLGALVKRLASSSYLLGDTFSAADLLWGMALQWGTMFKIVPENPVITDYVKRVTTRPSVVKVAAMDAEWVVEHERVAKEINS
jgi:glutathione S-transferase